MESYKKSNSFQAELENFCSKTSAHGLSQIPSSTTRKGKALWLLLFLITSIVSVLNKAGFLNDYKEYPVKTEVDSVFESKLTFPSVTVCNMNNFHMSRLQNDSTMRMLSVGKKWITAEPLAPRKSSALAKNK